MYYLPSFFLIPIMVNKINVYYYVKTYRSVDQYICKLLLDICNSQAHSNMRYHHMQSML